MESLSAVMFCCILSSAVGICLSQVFGIAHVALGDCSGCVHHSSVEMINRSISSVQSANHDLLCLNGVEVPTCVCNFLLTSPRLNILLSSLYHQTSFIFSLVVLWNFFPTKSFFQLCSLSFFFFPFSCSVCL